MSLPAASQNAMLNALVALGHWVALNTGDPGSTGAHLLGGALQSVTWPSASGGLVSWVGSILVPFPTTQTCLFFSVWSAATSGTFIYGGPLGAAATMIAGGNVPVTALTVGPLA